MVILCNDFIRGDFLLKIRVVGFIVLENDVRFKGVGGRWVIPYPPNTTYNKVVYEVK